MKKFDLFNNLTLTPIIYNKMLSNTAIRLYQVIADGKGSYTNKQLAKIMDCKPITIQKCLVELEKEKHISRTFELQDDGSSIRFIKCL